MDLYEYQGKQLFAASASPSRTGASRHARGGARGGRAARRPPVVVKAQVLAGGRGKAGGIKLAPTPAEAEAHARAILGLDIRGHVVRRVWIERASDIEREYYFSITFDRGAKRPLLMLTTRAAIDIEEVAAEHARRGSRACTSTRSTGFQPFHRAQAAASRAGIPAAETGRRRDIIARAYRAVPRDGCDARRDQPADRHPRRRAARARLQVHGRRQRALPPPRHRRDARRRRGRPAGADGARDGRHLRQARRHGRHPRQRRRPRDVDARRRRQAGGTPGQLPRRRRRRPGATRS